MGNKLIEQTKASGEHRSWVFFCPACKSPHQCDNRWEFNGNQEAPTFTGSVLQHEVPDKDGYKGWPLCHSYVTNGRIQYLKDCTHSMAGQTVDLPDWDSIGNKWD
jgi:hypothetical protein